MSTSQSFLLGQQNPEYKVELAKVRYVALLGFPLIATLIQICLLAVILCSLIGIIVGLNWVDRIDTLNFLLSVPCTAIIYALAFGYSWNTGDLSKGKMSQERLIRYHLLWIVYDIVRWATVPAAVVINNIYLIGVAFYIETIIFFGALLIMIGWLIILGLQSCRRTCKTEMKNYNVQV